MDVRRPPRLLELACALDLTCLLRVASRRDPHAYGFSVSPSVRPSMSVPLHWTPDGLPVGVMFSARFGDDGLFSDWLLSSKKHSPGTSADPGFKLSESLVTTERRGSERPCSGCGNSMLWQ
jgi:hypothetical protein